MPSWRAAQAGRSDPERKIRFAPSDLAALEAAAKTVGVSLHRLVRETAVRYGTKVAAEIRAEREAEAAAPAPGRGPDKARQPAAATAQLDRVLATRLGMPVALMRRAREAGRVAVDGAVHRDELVTLAAIEQGLALDGIAV